MITAAAPLPGGGVVMTANNARGITRTVRIERYRLGVVLLGVTVFSVLLSLFLARTIVRPLRRLARAACGCDAARAGSGGAPPALAARRTGDAGARALSDMSLALRARIDATESFAADVTHELKNPLASLRSAVDGLGRVSDPALQAQLIAIVRDDVMRLDRLITDISDASRLDAQLSRAQFEPVDLAALLAALVAQREERGIERDIRLDLIEDGAAMLVPGEGARLERVFENLIDNALSFSPDGGVVTILLHADDGERIVAVEDEGPASPPTSARRSSHRFHSIRPRARRSAAIRLGLAIARTIVDGHGGQITVENRAIDGPAHASSSACPPPPR